MDEFGLVVEGGEVNAGGQVFAELVNLCSNGGGDGNGITEGLPGDVKQDGGLAVGVDAGVDGQGCGDDFSYVSNAYGNAGRSGLDNESPKFARVVCLRSDKAKDKLMVGLIESGRIDDVGVLDRRDKIENGDAGGLQLGGVWNNVELGYLAALDNDSRDAGDTVERGF